MANFVLDLGRGLGLAIILIINDLLTLFYIFMWLQNFICSRISVGLLGVVFAALLGACSVEGEAWEQAGLEKELPLRIEPEISRVVGTVFSEGDLIGLSIANSENSAYLTNKKLVYNGSYFTADGLLWYNNITLKADLRAYYPYDATGEPERFRVAEDQSAEGYEASDLLAATATGVTPTASPVKMTFHHLFSRIEILVKNLSTAEITSLKVGGARLGADLDLDHLKASVREAESPKEITPHTITAGERYQAVIVPQTLSFSLQIETSHGKQYDYSLVQTTLQPATSYTIEISLTDLDLEAVLSAEIVEWTNGGTIPQEGTVDTGGKNEVSSASTVSHGGVEYAICTLADGRVWMAENLRYIPSGVTLGEGIFLPKESATEEQVAQYGLLYTALAALGVEQITTDNAAALEGTQGLCPKGWHLPTEAEFKSLFAAYPDGLPEALLFESPYTYYAANSSYVAYTQGGLLLTSTPTTNARATKIQVALFYTDGATSITAKENKNAHPARCIRDE